MQSRVLHPEDDRKSPVSDSDDLSPVFRAGYMKVAECSSVSRTQKVLEAGGHVLSLFIVCTCAEVLVLRSRLLVDVGSLLH